MFIDQNLEIREAQARKAKEVLQKMFDPMGIIIAPSMCFLCPRSLHRPNGGSSNPAIRGW